MLRQVYRRTWATLILTKRSVH